MEGQGVYSYDDGSVYKGNFHANKRSNFGRLELPNGDVYSGDWVDDVRQGVGNLFLSNGNVYEGYWVDNMKEGPGKFFYAATNKVYEGEWVEDSPRCGQFRDSTSEEQKRFGKPLIKKSGFSLPQLMLKNTRAVLDTTIAETRNERAHFRGVDVATIDRVTILAAEQAFEQIDTRGSGLVKFVELGPVLEVLGVLLNEDDMVELMSVLDITGDTDISFPEAVDIASFYERG
ncbi:morn3 [Symbiodinium microadriaticum]|nr:morn3 [Symbiodinium microadriaticum]